jgi:hypothetical protein
MKLGIKFAISAGALIILCVAGYAAWDVKYPTYSYRFQLGVEVEDKGEPKSAASVIEIKTVQRPCLNPSAPCSRTYVYGQAVVLDLGAKPLLVAPLVFGRDRLETNAFEYLAPFAFFGKPKSGTYGSDSNIDWSRRLSGMTGTRELTGDLTPLLVWFKDINDPKTIQQVLPDDLPRVFGPSVHFKRAWITLTDEPVPSGIERQLPWLKGMETYLDGASYSRGQSLANRLSSLHFKGVSR